MINNEQIGIKNNISYSQEILRKIIHLCSLVIPISYIFLTKEILLSLILPLLFLALLIDILSKFNTKFKEYYFQYFGPMLRPHEKTDKLLLNGASWVLISAFLVFLIFPKIIAIISFSILIISDLSAALIGRRFGKNKLFDKSWEGTSAFIFTGILVVTIYYFILSAPFSLLLFGSLGAIIAAFVEAASVTLKMDDNLSIPLSVGFVMWVGGIISNYYSLPYLHILN